MIRSERSAALAHLIAFVRLSRPHFLVGGFLMFTIGAATAPGAGIGRYLTAQLMVTSAQVTAHYVNEYADVAVDRMVGNRTFFSGGSGVLADRLLSPRVGLNAGRVTSLVAISAAVAVATHSPQAAALGLAALAISWLYSLPPVRLLGTGWGELATSLVVALLVPFIGSLSQGGQPTASLLWAVGILVPIHMMMMLAFEIPDLVTDSAAGKRVLAVRIGHHRAVALMAGLLGVAGFVAAIGWLFGGITAGAAAAVSLAAIPGIAAVVLANQERPAVLTTAAVVTLVVAASALALGSG